ncbi:hypothetical protein JKP88DRAFT_354680 [Tribonema minus]|uniref:Uncharacterized protein n=1 Tax=Tribonema minus TaxID=303371 RepID=A0A835YUC7_9STRA|nr:hypothetical protein JKP88DRAFT_354680 [Tribonema minus]
MSEPDGTQGPSLVPQDRALVAQLAELLRKHEQQEERQQQEQQRQQQQHQQDEQQQRHLMRRALQEIRQQQQKIQKLEDAHGVTVRHMQRQNERLRELEELNKQQRATEAQQQQQRQATDGVRTAHDVDTRAQQGAVILRGGIRGYRQSSPLPSMAKCKPVRKALTARAADGNDDCSGDDDSIASLDDATYSAGSDASDSTWVDSDSGERPGSTCDDSSAATASRAPLSRPHSAGGAAATGKANGKGEVRPAQAKQGRKCPHGRHRYICKDCGGKGICQHGRERRRCKDCGGAGVCEHGRRRRDCKDCGGAGICEHRRERRKCKHCGGAAGYTGQCRHTHLLTGDGSSALPSSVRVLQFARAMLWHTTAQPEVRAGRNTFRVCHRTLRLAGKGEQKMQNCGRDDEGSRRNTS